MRSVEFADDVPPAPPSLPSSGGGGISREQSGVSLVSSGLKSGTGGSSGGAPGSSFDVPSSPRTPGGGISDDDFPTLDATLVRESSAPVGGGAVKGPPRSGGGSSSGRGGTSRSRGSDRHGGLSGEDPGSMMGPVAALKRTLSGASSRSAGKSSSQSRGSKAPEVQSSAESSSGVVQVELGGGPIDNQANRDLFFEWLEGPGATISPLFGGRRGGGQHRGGGGSTDRRRSGAMVVGSRKLGEPGPGGPPGAGGGGVMYSPAEGTWEGLWEGLYINLDGSALSRIRQQWKEPVAKMMMLLFLWYCLGCILAILEPIILADTPKYQWITYSSCLPVFFWIAFLVNCSGQMIHPVIILFLLTIYVYLEVVLWSLFNEYSVSPSFKVECTLFFFAWCFANLVGAYSREQFARLVFYKLNSLQETERRSEQLLDEMLPAHVLYEFRQSGAATLRVVREYTEMTLLFADISGFTAYSTGVSAFKVVELVTKLFSACDDLSRRVGIYKVCTIGDCYVATLEPESEHIGTETGRIFVGSGFRAAIQSSYRAAIQSSFKLNTNQLQIRSELQTSYRPVTDQLLQISYTLDKIRYAVHASCVFTRCTAAM